ncbi:MAG: prenyltransferase [Porticoccus sp.]|nr:prenyltransferase [Porticoccus sp.]MBQ0808332.1 prenyltransferase [Porticoccus sp.]
MTQSWTIKDLLAISRAPFLALIPAVLFPAMVLSYQLTGQLAVDLCVLILLAALSAHIAANALNEYQDFNSGLDETTHRTPFSGGSGTLPAKPWLASSAKWLFAVTFLVMVVIGGYLSWRVGREILPLGILGGLIILVYTRWINRMPLACLFAPGIGFGLLMVNGTVFLMTGGFSVAAQYISWVVFFLCNGLLLLNQIPDIEADKAVGRRHLPILLGLRPTAWLYLLLLVGAYGSLIVGERLGALPATTLIALVTFPLGLLIWRGVLRSSEYPDELVPALGRNVLLVLITPVLVGVGLALG